MASYLTANLALRIIIGREYMEAYQKEEHETEELLGYFGQFFDSSLYELLDEDENQVEFILKDEVFQKNIQNFLYHSPEQLWGTGKKYGEDTYKPLLDYDVVDLLNTLDDEETDNHYYRTYVGAVDGRGYGDMKQFFLPEKGIYGSFLVVGLQFDNYGKMVMDLGGHCFVDHINALVRKPVIIPWQGQLL